MKFLDMWNRFMYTPSFNRFDVVAWIIVTNLAIIYSYWWFLLYIPSVFFSVSQERKLA